MNASTEYQAYLKSSASDPMRFHVSTERLGAEPRVDSREASESAKNEGNQLFAAKRFLEALRCYDLAISHWKDNTAALSNRAFAKLKLEDYRGCIGDCNAVLEIDSTYAKAWHRRGLARAALREFAGAETDFARVVELEPKNAQAERELKEVRLKRKEQEEEIAAIERKKQELAARERSAAVAAATASMAKASQPPPAAPTASAAASTMSSTTPTVVTAPKKSVPSRAPPSLTSSRASAPLRKQVVPVSAILDIPKVDLPVPATPSTTAYEFEAFWRSAKGYEGITALTSHKLFAFLKLHEAGALAQLFVRAISPDLFSDMLGVMSRHVAGGSGPTVSDVAVVDDDLAFVAALLVSLKKTARFDTNVMFLSKVDRESVRSAIEILRQRKVVPEEELAAVSGVYGL